MPWEPSPQAGFSSTEPWLPLNDDWPGRNVATQERDPASLLSLYRQLLQLRRAHDALSIGSFEIAPADEEILAFERRHCGDRLLVVLNLGTMCRRLILPSAADIAEVLASTHPLRPMDGEIAPDEGLILRLV